MKKELKYHVEKEITDDIPQIEIDLDYKDDFSEDNYIIKNIPEETKTSENIPIEIIKNGKEIGKTNFNQKNFYELFRDFFEKINDYDFQVEFYRNNIEEKIKKELDVFFNKYNSDYVESEITLEGEIKRMKKIAGIL